MTGLRSLTTSNLQMPIFVKSLAGKTIRLEVEPRDTVLAVKEQIKDKGDIPIDQQCLVVGDDELEDGHTLADCNIQEDSTVYLTVLCPQTEVCPPWQEQHTQYCAHFCSAHPDGITLTSCGTVWTLLPCSRHSRP